MFASLSFSNLLIVRPLVMLLPCASCKRVFTTQKKLSAHSARCSKSEVLKLTNILRRATKSNESRRSEQLQTEQAERGDEARITDHDEMDVDYNLDTNEVRQKSGLSERH